MFKALKAYFRVNFQLERLINETENRNRKSIQSNISSFWHILLVFFDLFWGQKSRFMDLFKVV